MDTQLYFYKENSESAMNQFDSRRLDGYKIMKSLEVYFLMNEPKFHKKYKKYGAARIAWSLSWQAAIFMSYEKFEEFLKYTKFKREVKKLFAYPSLLVALTSIILFASPRCFYILSNLKKPYRYMS